ncbi:MAG: class I SAM-dependent methyltransferase [Sphaerochaetaceae bacterium]
MDSYTGKDFGKLLKHNALQMRRIMLKEQTDCMRVYDRNLETLPITVDLYGPYTRITDYSDGGLSDEDQTQVCDIASRMLYTEPDHVIYHERKKRLGKEQHGLLAESSLEFTVQERGLSFIVDLKKRIDTGLFLDQAVARSEVRKVSGGMAVLNLFSYTGSFSVYAAAGGARSVVSVDLSSTYTDWCEKNLAANGFSGGAYPCVSQNAGEYIWKAVKERRKFDLIILDPPSFSNSRKMEHDFDVQRDYVYYIRLLNGLLVDGGKLLFSTNLGIFQFDKGRIHGYDVREITRDVAAPGFSTKKNSLRSWILEKNQDWKAPLEEEMRVSQAADGQIEHDGTEEVMAEEPMAEMDPEESVDAAEVEFDEESAEESDEESAEEELDDEDDDLVLDWDEEDQPVEGSQEGEATAVPVVARKPRRKEEHLDRHHDPKSEDGKNAKQRRFERRHASEIAAGTVTVPETYASPRSENNDRPREDRPDNRDHAPRSYDRPYDRDRAPRSFDRDRPQGERPRFDKPYDRDRAPRSFDRDRPQGDRPRFDKPYDRDRAPRSFDRDRPQGDRPRFDKPYDRDRAPRSFDRDRPQGDRPRFDKPYDRDRAPRSFDRDRPQGDRPHFDRPYDRDRAPRSFDRDRPQGDRPYENDRAPRSFDRDRPQGDRPRFDKPYDRDRAPRSFDRDRPQGDRPHFDRPYDRDRAPRSFDRDRPQGDRPRFDKPYDRDRAPRSFDRDRPQEDRPRFDKPYDRERAPRSFDRDRPQGDRPRFDKPYENDRAPRSFDHDRPEGDHAYESAPRVSDSSRSEHRSGPKPYGFDQFKPTRTRGEEETPFWLEKEKKDENN